jgi:hypothetical protein
MKAPFIFLSCMLFALTLRAQLPAATSGTGGNPFLNEQTHSVDDLRNAITKHPYTFEVDGWVMHVHFDANGTGAEEDWSFKWHARDGNTIELVSPKFPKMKAVFTFSDDYTTYTGFHFDGLKAVKGKQIVQH